ncbi:FKBP-type peptidyl-prolyl cis-trans isomerase [Sphingomonas sp.]|uniref:FKBP-type peptidyl-prolyl cis-trans isomerase n=1 Tax=Sphingomonas sp. TaxID=28214 RepID=UPI0025DC9895|nr:FKBP-type peptidyl-prolyl cis-trans isomerase [Sphingomonas sp.]
MNRSFLAPLLLLATLGACNAAPVPPPQTVAGADFLARNRTARNVVTTPSGLQYFIVKPGPRSGAHPAAGDGVNFDYEGKLLTGETFDSSFERHESLSGAVGNFVPGFNEALMLMRPGDEWIVWIPPELGYGAQESGPIPANSVLRFRMVLNSVTRSATPAG